jgi:indolepyruvate ferredoxin oxidoreductase beta subunit
MAEYPSREKLMTLLSEVTDKIILFDATALAEEAGDPIATNMVMLGALCASGILPYSEKIVIDIMKESIPQRYYSTNLKAFELGHAPM